MADATPFIAECVRLRLTARGQVQGVGFRPFVYRLASRLGVTGHVLNTADHVTIEVEGSPDIVEDFVRALQTQIPSHASLDALAREFIRPRHETAFTVLNSEAANIQILRMPLDRATCPDCVAELFDPTNRRHRYALTNCAACGPRFSIIEALPYDRARTTMRSFGLCLDCETEYDAPADRRFHAEPLACPTCGPAMRYAPSNGVATAFGDQALASAAALIEAGGVLALKGIGGYHLAVDATNTRAVTGLRSRKRRPSKPFALMVLSLAAARRLVCLSTGDAELLQSAAAPVVLVPRRMGSEIANSVAPGCAELGVMLPYSPLHHLLLDALGRPLVVTSGNHSGEPIRYDDRSAQSGLQDKADGFLSHNRRIRRPVEDSVVRTIAGAPQVLRLGRGIAPLTISLSPDCVPDGSAVLALGGQLKVAPTLLIGRNAVCAPHTGDMDSMAAENLLVRAVEDLQTLYRCNAQVVACDEHPDYATTNLAQAFGLPVVRVPHHLAHIMSVVAEHGLAGPVAGVAWDGTGYGGDGTVWGGEFLCTESDSWQRFARLRPFPLPGGDQAVREPRRVLLGLLYAIDRLDLLPAGLFDSQELRVLLTMLDAKLHTPVTSSGGRLFDGLAALLGVCLVNGHEGEAATRLEAVARQAMAQGDVAAYPFSQHTAADGGPLELDWEPVLIGAMRDRERGESVAVIAARLHETMAAMVAAGVERMPAIPVVLSGGCFQNRLLTERSMALLTAANRRVFINRRVPPNDGSLALGQAVWARRILAGG